MPTNIRLLVQPVPRISHQINHSRDYCNLCQHLPGPGHTLPWILSPAYSSQQVTTQFLLLLIISPKQHILWPTQAFYCLRDCAATHHPCFFFFAFMEGHCFGPGTAVYFSGLEGVLLLSPRSVSLLGFIHRVAGRRSTPIKSWRPLCPASPYPIRSSGVSSCLGLSMLITLL